MNKTEKLVIDFMAQNTYKEVIKKTICLYVMKNLAEINDSIKIEVVGGSSIHDYITTKNALFLELCKTDSVKRELLTTLSDVKYRKEDVVAEIMKQYGIDVGSNVTYIHDALCRMFDASMVKIENAVKSGDFKYIYHDLF